MCPGRHNQARAEPKAQQLFGQTPRLGRCSRRGGPSFPMGFDDEDIVEEALPADLALIPVWPPESLTEPDGQPTSNRHEFVTRPVPRCSLLQHADDTHRFLQCEIISPRPGCDD